MGDVTKLIDAMQEAIGFIVALKEQKARFVLEKAIAEHPDTRRVASGEICHCTCHNDPLYCRECKECSCHTK